MDISKTVIIHLLLFFLFVGVTLVGIVGDYWWCEKESSFDTNQNHIGLWNFCEKNMTCMSLADKNMVTEALMATRIFVCLGAFLVCFAVLFGILSDESLVKGVLAIVGSLLMMTGLLVWRYQYVSNVLDKYPANVNGMAFYIILGISLFSLFYGCLHMYVHYSKKDAVKMDRLPLGLTDEEKKQLLALRVKTPKRPELPRRLKTAERQAMLDKKMYDQL